MIHRPDYCPSCGQRVSLETKDYVIDTLRYLNFYYKCGSYWIMSTDGINIWTNFTETKDCQAIVKSGLSVERTN